jgi:hypothetical protein
MAADYLEVYRDLLRRGSPRRQRTRRLSHMGSIQLG